MNTIFLPLYIDPGTGSMLFTILIAVIGSLLFFLRDLKMRMGVLLSGRREEKGRRGKRRASSSPA